MFNKKNKKLRVLQTPINFTQIYSIFFIVFFGWMIAAIFYLLSEKHLYTFQDFVFMIFPLPCFLILLIYLIEKNDQIEFNNILVQEEIDRIKDLYDARKKAEDTFDSNG